MIAPPAAGDCEVIHDSLWGQPMNSVSSLAFVVVGIALLRKRPLLGALACAAGVGSFLFHGPMPEGAKWVHDVTLATLLLGVAFDDRPRIVASAAAAIGVGFAAFPNVVEVVTASIGVLALVVVVRGAGQKHAKVALTAVGILLVGGVIAAFSRTDGPLCAESSLIQGHAVWHVLGAAALWVWGNRTPD